MLGNRRSQACTTILPLNRVIRLPESFEDTGLMFAGDTNTGVNHLKQNLLTLRPGINFTHYQSDFALRGKFDRVAYQIYQNLSHTVTVAIYTR